MKYIIMLVLSSLITLSCSNSALSAADRVDKEKEVAIQNYLKVAAVDVMLNDALSDFLKLVPKESKEMVQDTFATIDKSKITTSMVKSIRKHFTTAEINTLTRFYSSPEGKTVMKKKEAMQADVLPVLQQEIAIALKKTYEKYKGNEHQ